MTLKLTSAPVFPTNCTPLLSQDLVMQGQLVRGPPKSNMFLCIRTHASVFCACWGEIW